MSRSIEAATTMKTPQLSLAAIDGWQVSLLAILVVMTCLSMTVVLHGSTPGNPAFWHAVAVTIVLCAFIPLFATARFSFGYFAGISFYSMIIGFFWASYFLTRDYDYDHVLARWSAVASLLLFLLPTLFQRTPLPRALMLSPQAMDRLLLLLLV